LGNDIYTANYLSTFPPSLKGDPDMVAFAEVVAEQLQITANLRDKNIIYARIDDLPEDVLDILAHDFKVDWYDSTAAIGVKRTVIKDSFKVHMRLGTPWAVKRVILAYFGTGRLLEWFQYDGDPYYFIVVTLNTAVTGPVLDKFVRILNVVKRRTSVLQELVVTSQGEWNYYDYWINKTWDEWDTLDLTWDELEAYEEE
jgi:phage tail P2-like protein